MTIKLNAAALICSLMLGATTVEPSANLFENEYVSVHRALEKAHVKSKFHEHTRNRVMVYLQPGQQRFEYQDSRVPDISDWTQGQVVWSQAAGMHAAEVVSDNPFNIIEVELKLPGTGKMAGGTLDPARIDPKHYKVEFENSQVRVLRAKIEPHGVAPMHEHSLNRVTIFLTDQDFRVTDAQGKVSLVKHKAGEAIWGTPITHLEENLSDEPFEVVAVELK